MFSVVVEIILRGRESLKFILRIRKILSNEHCHQRCCLSNFYDHFRVKYLLAPRFSSADFHFLHNMLLLLITSRKARNHPRKKSKQENIQQGDKRKATESSLCYCLCGEKKAREAETEKRKRIFNFTIGRASAFSCLRGLKLNFSRESVARAFFFGNRELFYQQITPTPLQSAVASTLISFQACTSRKNILPIPKTPINLALEPTQPVDFHHPQKVFFSPPPSACYWLCVGARRRHVFLSMSKSRHRKRGLEFSPSRSLRSSLTHQRSP